MEKKRGRETGFCKKPHLGDTHSGLILKIRRCWGNSLPCGCGQFARDAVMSALQATTLMTVPVPCEFVPSAQLVPRGREKLQTQATFLEDRKVESGSRHAS